MMHFVCWQICSAEVKKTSKPCMKEGKIDLAADDRLISLLAG
jgi:hypothetical protein